MYFDEDIDAATEAYFKVKDSFSEQLGSINAVLLTQDRVAKRKDGDPALLVKLIERFTRQQSESQALDDKPKTQHELLNELKREYHKDQVYVHLCDGCQKFG